MKIQETRQARAISEALTWLKVATYLIVAALAFLLVGGLVVAAVLWK